MPNPASPAEAAKRAVRSGLIAYRQHHGDQIPQRPLQVTLADLGQVIIHADVAYGGARDRVVVRRGRQGAPGQVLLPGPSSRWAVSITRCYMVPSGLIWVTTTLIRPSRSPPEARPAQRPSVSGQRRVGVPLHPMPEAE